MSEPKQKPGRSKQDYGTPPEFIEAVKRRLCVSAFDWDLAATYDNAIAPNFFSAADDALAQPWPAGPNWLNPPFARIAPWVRKAKEELCGERESQTVMLVPAAVGSNWWRDYVHGVADVIFINGRIRFVGCTDPFPKDCALLLYQPFAGTRWYVWDWRKTLARGAEAS